MNSIMKAQIFQLKKERWLFIAFILVIALVSINILNEDAVDCGEFVCSYGQVLPQLSLIFLFVSIGLICGKDFNDQTGNYELMSGHTRLEVYLGRTIIGLFIGTFGSLLICLCCVGIGCVYFGWGDSVSFSQVMQHIILMVFPFFRIGCETIFLTFIIRNAYAIMAVGFVYAMALSELIVSLASNPCSFFLGFTNLIRLCDYTAFSTYSPVTGDAILVYDATLSAVDIWGTIGWSVGVGILFLILGYHFFKTDDIR